MDAKLEKHFKKKYKWDKTKTDGGLDEVTFEKYEDELSQAEREFSDFHRVYDTSGPSDIFGMRKSTSFANHPKNYLDEASEKLQSITGEGLNVDFYKNYTDDVLTKYPKPESFQYGGIAGMLGERTGYESGRRAGQTAGQKRKASPTDWYTDKIIADNLGKIKSDMFLKYILPERSKRFLENITEDETYGTYDEDSGYSGIVKGDFITKDGKRIEFPAPADKDIDVEGLLEFLDKHDEGGVSKDHNVEDMQPFDKRFYWEEDYNKENFGFVKGYELKGGGLAGMLGEPTYADENQRVRYGKGKLVDAGRRLFLEMMGGAAATGVAAKTGLLGFLKAGKPAAVETLTSVPIKNADGMPSWFKPLVNRVIQEGDDVTKQFAWKERQIVHSKKLGENQGVKVTQDLDDQTIRVEYQSADNMGGVDDAVNLEYKAAEEIPTKKGSVKTKPTFEANEAYPLQDPKDYKWITFEDSNVVNKVDDLYSDTSALKQFGTGKNLSKKESAIAKQKRERVKKINEAPDEELGPLIDYPTPDDFATGGRVPLALGRGTEQAIAENKALEEKLDQVRGIEKFYEERKKKAELEQDLLDTEEGVLMDPPFYEQMPHPKATIVPNMSHPDRHSDFGVPWIIFDDGTIFYPDSSGSGGKFIDRKTGETVEGPAEGAKPVNTETMKAAEGGRVPLVKGKIVKGIMSLGKKKKIDDLGGSKADPFSPDFDMKAEADLIAKTPFTSVELKRLFGNQIDDNIIREIAAMDPAKQLKAIEDVKLYIRNRKNLKQELMLRDLDVTGLEPHASGGLAGMLGE